jgi:hypothetical protein
LIDAMTGLPEGRTTTVIGELEEAVGELNAVLTLLENGNAEVKAEEQADAVG